MLEKNINNEIHSALTERVRSRICLIGGGTGNLVKIDEDIYIITCKHVADYFFDDKNNYVLLKNNTRIYQDNLEYVVATNDDVDIAVIKLSNIEIIEYFYEEDDFELIENFDNYDFSQTNFFICGFPEQLNFNKESKVYIPYFSYMTLKYESRPSNERHIYLKYDRDSLSNITKDGLLMRLPEAPGLSGAFILQISPFKGKLKHIWQPAIAKITAIQVSWNKREWIKGSNIKYLFDLIKSVAT